MDIEKSVLGVEFEANEKITKITTHDAEAYMQRLIDLAVDNARKNSDHPESIKDVQITLSTINCSKKFKPLMLILPTSVISQKSAKKNRDEHEASIFSTNKSGKDQIYIKPWLYPVISTFLYDTKDVEAFNSMNFRRTLGIKPKVYYAMKDNRTPRLQKFDRGEEYVVCIIDPIRFFHYITFRRHRIMILSSKLKSVKQDRFQDLTMNIRYSRLERTRRVKSAIQTRIESRLNLSADLSVLVGK